MTESQASVRRSTLPLPLTRFIGRENELALAVARLNESRLVTLVGPGGIGKTRLATEAARAWLDTHAADAWFVDLSPVGDSVGIERAMASALGVIDDGKTKLGERVLSYLRDGSGLVILDNCEQVIDAAADYAGALLQACPDIRVLATSREPLDIAGESLLEVPPLDIATEALALFEDRSRAVGPSTELDVQQDVVRQICQQLEGLPLAIELAAARTRALSLSEINARLGDRFTLLTAGGRGLPDRHRTLTAAVEWSYQMLTPKESALYARLSVFAGGWTLAAAEAACSGGGIEREEVVDLLAHLVGRSLVTRDANAEPARYRMLETMRAYAASRLEERDVWARRHFEWTLALALEAEPKLQGRGQAEWLDCLSQERDNIRVALNWGANHEELAEERLQLAVSLLRLWWLRGPIAEGEDWLRRFIPAPGVAPSVASIRARVGLGILRETAGDFEAAREAFDEAVRAARSAGHEASLGEALAHLAGIEGLRGSSGGEVVRTIDEARTLLERSGSGHDLAVLALNSIWCHPHVERDWEADLELLRGVGDPWLTGGFLNSLGEIARDRGDLDGARRHYEEAIEERKQTAGALTWAPNVNLAYVALMQGDAGAASPLLQMALRNAVDRKALHGVSAAFLGASLLATARGEQRLGARLLGAASAIDKAIGFTPSRPDAAVGEKSAMLGRDALGEPAFELELQAGRAQTMDSAVGEAEELFLRAAEASNPGESTVKRPGGLSRQEAEVLRLLASGHTNREIAARLVLSVRTIENHIANSYGKIGARGRAEATAWAIANGVVAVGAVAE